MSFMQATWTILNDVLGVNASSVGTQGANSGINLLCQMNESLYAVQCASLVRPLALWVFSLKNMER